MTDIEPFLERLGLLQYYDVFTEEGFDTWETLLDVKETDLEALGVKLGHRRRLQRAIAEYRGYSSERPLGSPAQDISGQEMSRLEGGLANTLSSREHPTPAPIEPKRKYRRHPKPDEHAPEKPPSAYVLFANRIRDEIRHENLSFTETARLVGERWQKLDPSQKEPFESLAASLKETYNSRLAAYKRTDEYREYQQYLADFKAKHGPVNESKIEPKRAKIEGERSASWMSTSTVDNNETSSHSFQHARGSSRGSLGSTSYSGHSTAGSSSLQVITSLANLGAVDRRRGSPNYQFNRERQIRGSISGVSSGAEDVPGIYAEQGERPSRVSVLSLSPDPTGTSPPLTAKLRAGILDAGYGSGSPTWPRHGPVNFTSSPPQSESPTKPFTLQPFTTSPGEISRDRHQDIGRASHSMLPPPHRPQQQQQTSLKGSLPISHLVGPNAGLDQNISSAQRVLPLPYSSSGSHTQPNSTIFGHASILAPVSPLPPNMERVPLLQRYASAARSRSDDEAANALAGLSDVQSSSRAKHPRSTR